jgi:hypothetical protein
MKRLLSIFCALLFVPIINCGSSGSSSDLSTDQVNAISKAMVTAMGATDYSASPTSMEIASAGLASVNVDTMTFTHSATYDRFTGNANDVSPCAGGGHITYIGTLVIYCKSGATYDDAPGGTGYLLSCGVWHSSIDFTFHFGDVTNNLNDCNVGSGLIVDGTVYFTGAGDGSALSMSLDGTLSLNTRGPTGGLTPYCASTICSDCLIAVSFPYGGTATGTICGYSVSSANTASLAEFEF